MPLLVLDPELTIVEVNDAYLAGVLRHRDELIGRNVFDAFPDNPDDREADGVDNLRASLHRVLRLRVSDVMAIQKYDIEKPSGFEIRYWAPVNAPVLDPDGEVELILHRVEDVTAYVQSQQPELHAKMEAEVFARHRLQERNVVLQAVADSLDTVVIGCDAAGRPTIYNQAARELAGDRLDGRPADQWPRLLHLENADEPLRQAMRGIPVRDSEVILRPPGQARRIFRMHACPLTGLPGLAVVVALDDVTVRRRVARLQAGELEVADLIGHPEGNRLAEVMRTVGTAAGWSATEFWTVDDVTRLLHREARWPESGPSVPPDPPAESRPVPSDSPKTGAPDSPAGSRLLSGPVTLASGEGLPGQAWEAAEPVWTTGLGEPLRAALAIPIPAGPNPLGVLVCYSDTEEVPEGLRTAVITGIGARLGEFLERRRAERLAAELDRTRDEYIALVGHELRTPLTSIQSYTDLMLGEPDLDEEHRSALEVMRRNTAGLHGIVMRLLDVAGMRSGRIDLRTTSVDLAEIVRAAAARRPGVQFDGPASMIVDGDPERLSEVADELLANAATWAAEDSTIRIGLRPGDRVVELSVSNTGERIKAHEQADLFDPFFRGESARHNGIPGNGLGLTVARAIVEQHGGTLSVSGPDDDETTFTVRLPARSLASTGTPPRG
ncbi:sensor histidine kinase [Actinoplanes missouriensis]|uniref:sensor histidine kinase n=1 Tax=Actinoplanes missouriensis TaxID=1866 RepID=UPI0022B24E18|nr:ATP-binding protein [Actinoplanes missouriensis]